MTVKGLFFGVAALCLAAAPASAQTYVFASGLPESSYLSQELKHFMSCIETESKGKANFQFYPNGTLVKRENMLRATQAGQVQFAELNISAYGNEDEIFNLPPIPGLARTIDDLKLLWETEEAYLKEWFASRNVRLLFPLHWPGQGIYSKAKLNTESDTKGKLYVYSPATQRLGELMGFNPVVLPFSEIPQAFATGMIEAMYTSAQTGVDIQAWDFVKHYSFAGGGSQIGVGVNAKTFDQLAEPMKKAVLDCADRARTSGFEATRRNDAALLEALRQKGIEVNNMPAPVRAEFVKAGEAMLEEWKKKASPKAREILNKYLAARKS